MKVATLKDGSRDGRLVVVSRDLSRYADASDVAPTLLAALETWATAEDALRARFDELESGAIDGEPFDPRAAHAPLPRSPQWIDGSVFANHGRLMARALHPDRENSYEEFPLVYQGASDDFIGACDDVVVAEESEGIDFEGEVAVVVDEVPMRTRAEDAEQHVKLLLLCNDVSLRELCRARAVDRVRVLQREAVVRILARRGDPGRAGRGLARRPLRAAAPRALERRVVREPRRARDDVHVPPADRARDPLAPPPRRHDHRLGHGVERGPRRRLGLHRRASAIELIEHGAPQTPFMRFGDRVRLEMLDGDGASIFGAIDQRIVSLEDARAAVAAT